MYGYQKPLNEQCATITGGIVSPKQQCNSLWNKTLRRKTLVKISLILINIKYAFLKNIIIIYSKNNLTF